MSPGVIEVVFATGTRLRISGPVDTPIVSAVMQALADCAAALTEILELPSGSGAVPSLRATVPISRAYDAAALERLRCGWS